MASERLRTFERDSFETIISLGYGHIYKEDQKYPKFQTLPKLEEEARKAIAGMWSICVTDALVERFAGGRYLRSRSRFGNEPTSALTNVDVAELLTA
jgi:hypothetical protein